MCELKSCIVLQKINKTSGSLTEFRNNKHLHVFVLKVMVAKCMCTTATYVKGDWTLWESESNVVTEPCMQLNCILSCLLCRFGLKLKSSKFKHNSFYYYNQYLEHILEMCTFNCALSQANGVKISTIQMGYLEVQYLVHGVGERNITIYT